MRLHVPIALLTAAALLGGCTAQGAGDDSSGDFKGEQAAVAKAIERFETAASKREEGKICDELLTDALVKQLATGGRSCAKAVDDTLADTDSYALTVERVQVSGTTASARVKADRGDSADEVATFTLAKVGQSWKLSGFGS